LKKGERGDLKSPPPLFTKVGNEHPHPFPPPSEGEDEGGGGEHPVLRTPLYERGIPSPRWVEGNRISRGRI